MQDANYVEGQQKVGFGQKIKNIFSHKGHKGNLDEEERLRLKQQEQQRKY